jgi:hypothetical protein
VSLEFLVLLPLARKIGSAALVAAPTARWSELESGMLSVTSSSDGLPSLVTGCEEHRDP